MAKKRTKVTSEITKRNKGKVRVGVGQAREFRSDLLDIFAEEAAKEESLMFQEFMDDLCTRISKIRGQKVVAEVHFRSRADLSGLIKDIEQHLKQSKVLTTKKKAKAKKKK